MSWYYESSDCWLRKTGSIPVNPRMKQVYVEWRGADWRPSPYLATLTGQIEYWFMHVLTAAMKRALFKLPLGYWGAYNAMGLYLEHPSYSPFVDSDILATKDTTDWDIRNYEVL